MKLLMVTQVVDTEDPVLGFFVRWIEELAKETEHIEVICLKEGKHTLPANVRVHSLGKPYFTKASQGTGARLRYTLRFLKLVWQLRHDYDAVFVHMNQEYILIAGWLWKLLGKRIYMWRNHFAGSWKTYVAAAFCTKVFCTSKSSYTAKYKKTILMPVGVDTKRFYPDEHVVRKSHSILFFARMSPIKRPEMLIDALAMLAHDGFNFSASLVGSPLTKDEVFYENLKEKVRSLGLTDRISFYPSIPNSQAPDLYRTHEIFVNTTPSGSFDKTLFEASASGCRVLSSSTDFSAIAGPDSYFDSSSKLAACLASALTNPPACLPSTLVGGHSLSTLAKKLINAILPL